MLIDEQVESLITKCEEKQPSTFLSKTSACLEQKCCVLWFPDFAHFSSLETFSYSLLALYPYLFLSLDCPCFFPCSLLHNTQTQNSKPPGGIFVFVFSYSLNFIIICFFVLIVQVFAFCPYCTSHTTQTSMSPAGFDPAIVASERLQTLALDRSATGIGAYLSLWQQHRALAKWHRRGETKVLRAKPATDPLLFHIKFTTSGLAWPATNHCSHGTSLHKYKGKGIPLQA